MIPLQLKDSFGRDVAELSEMRFDKSSGAYVGMLKWKSIPEGLEPLLTQLESLVEGQSFSGLDELQAQVDRLGLRAKFAGGEEEGILELYVSHNGRVSFRLV